MHLEFACYLRELLNQSSYADSLGQEVVIDVTDCPRNYGHRLSTDCCFQLAQILQTAGHKIHARQLANQILVEHQHQCKAQQQKFTIEVGGEGFLNGTPTKFCVDYFFTRLLESQGLLLFQQHSVFSPDSSQSTAEQLLNLSWEKILNAAFSLADSRAFVLQLQPDAPFEDRLMLLALLGDAELDWRPYRAGLAGRQNVPWYFNQFLVHSEHFRKSLETNLKFKLGLERESSRKLLEVEPVMDESSPLLYFRKHLFSAINFHRVPEFVNYLIIIIRQFYLYYNHPVVRSLELGGEDGRVLARVLPWLSCLRSSVARAIFLLQKSCMSAGFALKLEQIQQQQPR